MDTASAEHDQIHILAYNHIHNNEGVNMITIDR